MTHHQDNCEVLQEQEHGSLLGRQELHLLLVYKVHKSVETVLARVGHGPRHDQVPLHQSGLHQVSAGLVLQVGHGQVGVVHDQVGHLSGNREAGTVHISYKLGHQGQQKLDEGEQVLGQEHALIPHSHGRLRAQDKHTVTHHSQHQEEDYHICYQVSSHKSPQLHQDTCKLVQRKQVKKMSYLPKDRGSASSHLPQQQAASRAGQVHHPDQDILHQGHRLHQGARAGQVLCPTQEQLHGQRTLYLGSGQPLPGQEDDDQVRDVLLSQELSHHLTPGVVVLMEERWMIGMWIMSWPAQRDDALAKHVGRQVLHHSEQ